MEIFNPLILDHIKELNGSITRLAIAEIGGWNMDSTGFKTVSYPSGVSLSKIVNIQVLVEHDTNGSKYLLNYDNTVGAIHGYWTAISSNIVLYRTTAGYFDDPDFDDSTMNRGYVNIWYID